VTEAGGVLLLGGGGAAMALLAGLWKTCERVELSMTSLEKIGARAGAALKASGQSVAVAESSAGGVISASLLAVAGASAYFKGGGVVYTGHSKKTLMSVAAEAMAEARAATEAHALHLARSARLKLGADWGIGETGAAGPTGNRYGDAPGHTCIGVAGPVEIAITIETGSQEREDNMAAFAAAALDLLTQCIERNEGQ
jgi:PncC family amidohydrolase